MRDVVIESVRPAATGILELVLVDEDGAVLPPWEPGAHIDVSMPRVPVRQYSLCGDPADRTRYRIAVLRSTVPGSASQLLHARATVGEFVQFDGPRNKFRLQDAESYLFLAGGIGVTPILPMVREVERRGRPWRLCYGARTRAHLAFLAELSALRGRAVVLVAEDEMGRLDVDREIRAAPAERAVYACGPAPMLAAVEDACRTWRPGRPPALERFTPSAPTGQTARAKGKRAFDVELRRTGVTLTVPANQTLLSVVREAVPGTPSSCEEGVCGTCETAVLAGVPEHHDEVLTDAERAANDTMMICVGRSVTPLLVLDV